MLKLIFFCFLISSNLQCNSFSEEELNTLTKAVKENDKEKFIEVFEEKYMSKLEERSKFNEKLLSNFQTLSDVGAQKLSNTKYLILEKVVTKAEDNFYEHKDISKNIQMRFKVGTNLINQSK